MFCIAKSWRSCSSNNLCRMINHLKSEFPMEDYLKELPTDCITFGKPEAIFLQYLQSVQ